MSMVFTPNLPDAGQRCSSHRRTMIMGCATSTSQTPMATVSHLEWNPIRRAEGRLGSEHMLSALLESGHALGICEYTRPRVFALYCNSSARAHLPPYDKTKT